MKQKLIKCINMILIPQSILNNFSKKKNANESENNSAYDSADTAAYLDRKAIFGAYLILQL